MATWLNVSSEEHKMTLKVVKFEASWCGPCKALTPVWNEVVESTDDVDFEVVDIDEDPETASNMAVRAVPTLVFVKDGAVVDTLVGLHNKDTIVNKIEELK